MTDYTKLYIKCDQQMNSADFLNYQSSMRTKQADADEEEKRLELSKLEDKWWQEFAQPLADFMGDFRVWEEVLATDFPDTKLNMKEGKQPRNPKNKGTQFEAIYLGAHFVSRKPGEIAWFDPFDHFQLFGTNQFCQSFALMNLVSYNPNMPKNLKLPIPRSTDNGFKRYYRYTKHVLGFIKVIIDTFEEDGTLFDVSRSDAEKKYYPKNEMLRKVNECISHYAMCVNIPKYDCQLSGPPV